MAQYNPFSDIYAGAGSPTSISLGTGLFQQPQTTDEYFKEFHPSMQGGFIPSSSGVVGRPQAENVAQYSGRASDQMVKDQESVGDDNYFGKAYEAINSLNQKFRTGQEERKYEAGQYIRGGHGLKYNVGPNGVPYYTMDTSPTELHTIDGQTITGRENVRKYEKSREIGMTPEKRTALETQWKTQPHSWEKKNINPYTGTSITPASKFAGTMQSPYQQYPRSMIA
jgi:hypothetical protein